MTPLKFWGSTLLLAAAMPLYRPACAAESEKTETIVYQNQSFEGSEHKLNYAPAQVKEVYLLAGRENVIDPRHTLAYMWPLKREYVFEWEHLNVPVTGDLEVLQDKKIIARLKREDVAIRYPGGIDGGGSVVLRGEDARRGKQEYDARTAAANRKIIEANQAHAAYEAALRKFLRDRAAGIPAELPKKPAPIPAAEPEYMSDLCHAFVLKLPEGRYTLRMVDGDAVVEGSERDVHVFKPLQTDGVLWNVVPEERWTRRLPSEDTDTDIYVKAGRTVFLSPRSSELYDANAIARVREPQAASATSRTVWIDRKDIPDGTLLLSDGNTPLQSIAWAGFRVKQLAGEALGYRIEDAGVDPSRKPDFQAFALPVPEGADGRTLHIVLRDAKGSVRPASTRLIRVVDTRHVTLLWIVALLPLLAGSIVLYLRRRNSSVASRRTTS